MRLPACAALVALVCTTVAARQQAADPTPRFRSSARLVQVSVVVRDRRNRPVDGLDRAAFRLVEDGKEQPVSLFIAASRSDAEKSVTPPAITTTDASPRFTNRIASPSTGGVVAIIFDQLNSSHSQQVRARAHLLTYLRSLRPSDRVALYVLGQDGLRVLYDFTTDAEMLIRALDAVEPGSVRKLAVTEQQIPPALLEGLSAFALGNLVNMNAAVKELRAETTLAALEQLAARLAGVPGRKNIVWLSPGFPFVIGKASPSGTNNSIQAEQTKRATRALSTADAALYPVDLRGLLAGRGAAVPTLQSVYEPIDGLRVAADWTGGRAFFNTNGLSDAIANAIEDSRSTYVLGYYPANTDWNGKFRNIKVTVAREGVDVRHRPGYLAHPSVGPAPDVRQKGVVDALGASLEATALPFDIVAEVTSEHAVLRLYVDPAALTITEAAGRLGGEIDVAITQMLEDRRQVPEMSSSYPFSVPVAARDRLAGTPIELTRTIRLAPDVAQVRVVIRDAGSAATGSIFIDAARLRPARPR
jgi:VWFA-related protein